jgi:hypothetical protein
MWGDLFRPLAVVVNKDDQTVHDRPSLEVVTLGHRYPFLGLAKRSHCDATLYVVLHDERVIYFLPAGRSYGKPPIACQWITSWFSKTHWEHGNTGKRILAPSTLEWTVYTERERRRKLPELDY